MRYILFVILCSHIPYLLSAPSPDTTSVQIQNYDGPIFLHSPKLNCCPLCNSVLNSPLNENELEKSLETNPENYPRKAVYGNNLPGNNCGMDTQENNEDNVLNINMVPYGKAHTRNANEDSCIHNNSGKLGANSYYGAVNDKNRCNEGYFENNNSRNINTGTAVSTVQSVTHKNTRDSSNRIAPGNNYPLTVPARNSNTGTENICIDSARNPTTIPASGTHMSTPGTYNTFYTPTVTGTESTCVTKPLSSYLPINTAADISCFRVPITVCNQAFCPEDETILVPQKFSYSLVLDGEVAPSGQNGPYECKCYCYY